MTMHKPQEATSPDQHLQCLMEYVTLELKKKTKLSTQICLLHRYKCGY